MAKAYYFNYIPVSDTSQFPTDEAVYICDKMTQTVIDTFKEYELQIKNKDNISCEQDKKLLSDEKSACCIYPDKLCGSWDHSTWDYSKDKSGEIFVAFKKNNEILVSFGTNRIAKESTNEEIISKIRDNAVVSGILPSNALIYEAKERIDGEAENNIKVISNKLSEVVRGKNTAFKEDLEREKKLEIERQERYEYYEGILKQLPYFNDMFIGGYVNKPDYEGAYKRSLQPRLSDACQKVINDSIGFWENWKSLPTIAEKKYVFWEVPAAVGHVNHTFWSSEVKSIVSKIGSDYGTAWLSYYGSHYNKRNKRWLAKYKWADGSIHCNFCVLDNTRMFDFARKFGFLSNTPFLREESSFLQEVQQKLDRYNNNIKEGSQEYVQLCYYESQDDSLSAYYYLFIFRDGTVFYDNPGMSSAEKAYPLENSTKLYDFLLRKLKYGPDNYMQYQWR